MWKAFQRYRELEPQARKLFWRAATLLPLVSVSLRVRGFQRTKDGLEKKIVSLRAEHLGNGSLEILPMTCRMVKAGAHYGFGHPTCLEESLVLWYLLRAQNVAARFRIGVRKSPGKFEAHAWVECDGKALDESAEHCHYAAFESEFSNLPGEDA